jgi:tRNA(Ile)-lysidine synthase
MPVRLLHTCISGKPSKGESIEAWARAVRYGALQTMAHEVGTSLVLLAHHRQDQAETLLLQALRGAGIDGLAAMPMTAERHGITWSRPWIDRPREAIDAYVRRHRLKYIEDDSNTDTRLARNRLRLDVWPALTQAFPQAEVALASAAAWAGQARECLAELAAIDIHGATREHGLSLSAWSSLSEARRSNALRFWLRTQMGAAASTHLVQRLLEELPGAGARSWQTPVGGLRKYRGHLRFIADAFSPLLPAQDAVTNLGIYRAGTHSLHGWGGELIARRVKEGGVPIAWLAQLDLRSRQGGEQFQSGIGRPARTLKKQYQAADVPAWLRNGPLVYSGGQLLFVPGLGIDARVVALPGQAQLSLEWRPTSGD